MIVNLYMKHFLERLGHLVRMCATSSFQAKMYEEITSIVLNILHGILFL